LAGSRFRQDTGHLPASLVGTKLPSLRVKTLNGATKTLDWRTDKRPVVMYIFSPQCAWCMRNLENIKALSAMRGSQYRFVGISLLESGLAAYVSEQKLSFETYASPVRSDGQKFGSMTPETLVTDSHGVINHDWQGAYTPQVQNEIESLMGVRLPGLTDSPKTAAKPVESGS
jgi:hypothetical protein